MVTIRGARPLLGLSKPIKAWSMVPVTMSVKEALVFLAVRSATVKVTVKVPLEEGVHPKEGALLETHPGGSPLYL
jgi:hypothetical protein